MAASSYAIDTLPSNVDAERMILGAILLENHALSEAEEKLTPDDFSLDSHRRIYQCLTEGLPRRPIIDEYIRIVKDKSLLRQLMLICSAAIARAADQSETALDVL